MSLRALLTCLLSFFALVVTGTASGLCPVSRHYDATQHFHRYPPSFYGAQVPRQYFGAYNCNIHIVNEPDPSPNLITICDRNVSLCPVRQENVNSALSVATWPQYAEAFKYIGRKSNVNIFYLGGSMTAGTETFHRCRCSDAEDRRCPPLPYVLPHLLSMQCSWPTHLTRWLNNAFPDTNFQFHDYSFGGRTSKSSDYFIDMVHKSQANLSNPTLIFMDFSVNDLYKQTSDSLETFIHTIYDNFGRHYHIKPTVVVIEQYPHGMLYKAEPSEDDYALRYRKFAKQYNLILISMREVYWTYFGPVQDRNVINPDPSKRLYPISPLNVNVHMPLHAPWYIHLFMADMLANCIKRYVLPFRSNVDASANTIRNLHDPTKVPIVTYTSPAPLPELPLTRRTELQFVCNISIPYLVSAVPRPVDIPLEQLPWQKGWIEHVSHRTAGWEINSLSDPSARALSFPLRKPVAQLRNTVVKVSFLGSYEGTGTASVHVCGGRLTNLPVIDALWTYHVSIPFPIVHALKEEDVVRCQLLPEQDRFLSIVYAPGTDKADLRVVHNHLLKVFDVQVCTSVLTAEQLLQP